MKQIESHNETIKDIKNKWYKQDIINLKQKNKELVNLILWLHKKQELLLWISKKPYKQQEITPNIYPKDSEAVAVMTGSDWHSDEIVNPKTVNNLNEYNPDIAKHRAQNFFKNWLKLTEIMSKDIKISDIVMFMLWDFMSWYIHTELIENNSMSPTQAVIFVKQLICDWISMILDKSNYKITMVMKPWNHWRTTDKTRISTGYKNSYEWMMYHIIANEFKNNPRIKFIIEEWYHTYIKIFNQVLRTHHWDAINYWWWVGGITIPINKAIAQWNKAKHADIDYSAHFHQLINMKNFVSNWSLIWYNAYANRIKADYEDPQQSFSLIDKDHWKTVNAPIFVK